MATQFIFIHVLAPLSFPPPVADESWFIIPAISVSEGHWFAADRALIPDIYWMPPAIYIVYGLALSIAHHGSLVGARVVSFLFMVIATLLFGRANGKVLGKEHPFVKVTVLCWALCLPEVVAGDIVRPEALSICLSLSALLSLFEARWIGAAGFTLLSLLTHPLLAAPILLVFAAALPAFRPTPPRPWEWGVLAMAIGLASLEATRFSLDFHTYLTHWRFQVHFKTSLASPFNMLLSTPITFALLAASAIHCRRSSTTLALPSTRQLLLALFALAALQVWVFAPHLYYRPFVVLGVLALMAAGFAAAAGRGHVIPIAAFHCIAIIIVLISWLPKFDQRPQSGIYTSRPHPLDPEPQVLVDLAIPARRSLLDGTPHRVLVSPALYYAFLHDRDPEGLDVWTWTSFRASIPVPFDRVVLTTIGRDWGNVGAHSLQGYICTESSTLSTRDGGHSLDILTVAPNPDSPKAPFRPCSPPVS